MATATKNAAKKAAKKSATRRSAPQKRAARRSRTDALDILVADHATVDGLFEKYDKLGPNAMVGKQDLVDRIITELSIHAAIEEQVLYPAIRECSDEMRAETLEALEEHHVAKLLLAELQHMTPEDERFDAKVAVLAEVVRHHVEEEEGELFPEVRGILGDELLADMGEALLKAKDAAPTRPHPAAPDEPPGNVVAVAMSGIVDRVRDLGRGVARDAGKVARSVRRNG